MKSRHLIPAALAALLTLSAVTACESGASAPETTNAGNADTAPAAAEAAEEAVRHYTDELAPVDYNGAEFKIYTTNYVNGWTNNSLLSYAEEENGEVINDALVARDRYMEDTFNVKLVYELDPDGNTGTQTGRIKKSVTAGDDSFHMILLDLGSVCAGVSKQGMLYPLDYVGGIDLKADYWMPKVNDSCRIGNSLYFVSCAISPRYYGSVYVVMFNRDMAKELDLDNMYDLVANDQWTLDRMFDMAKLAARDLNGDGKMDPSDQLGAMYGSQEGYVLAGGFNFVANQNGKLVCSLDDAKTVNYMQKLADCFQTYGVFYEGHPSIDYEGVINNGTALFFNPCTCDLTDYRELPYDIGILPIPKMSEEQDGYIAFSQPWINVTPMVPITVSGDALAMTGTLTNAMAAYGYDYVRPACFDNVICLKGTRDAESARIVEKMFENVTFDLAINLGISSVNSITRSYLASDLGKQDIVSLYAAQKSKVDAELQSIMATYAANEAEILG